MDPITEVDENNTDSAYWEEILRSHGLSMKRGVTPRVKYMGGENNLVGLEERNEVESTGKVVLKKRK